MLVGFQHIEYCYYGSVRVDSDDLYAASSILYVIRADVKVAS